MPATDEEILEVNETDMHIASDACQTVGYLPAVGLPSRLSQLESSEGLVPLGLLHVLSCLKPFVSLTLISLLFSRNICLLTYR